MTASSDNPDPNDQGDEPFGGFGKTFGRRKGRPLRNHHQSLFDDLLPRITVPLPRRGDELLREALQPHSLFENEPEDVWLEIGYGGGEHLSGQAKANPGVGFIGGEFFTQGVAKLLAQIEEDELANVRLYAGDARELLAAIKPHTLSRIFVLYPDPWPKKRHERRRFISPWSVAEFSRALKPGGHVRVATDIPIYCRWALRHFLKNADFSWLAEGPSDWRQTPQDWISTRYEAKALREGRTPMYLDFEKL